MSEPRTLLVMLSGGFDSAFMLHHLLTTTTDAVHAHHISLRTVSEPRWAQEDQAARDVVEYCQAIRPLTFSESRFDFSFKPYVGRDSDLQLLVAAKVAPNLPGHVQVAIGWEGVDMQSPVFRKRWEERVSHKLWYALCDCIDPPFHERVNRELLFPLMELGLEKRTMLATLPPDLARLTWSCRKPVVDVDGGARKCGQCPPCVAFKAALAARD